VHWGVAVTPRKLSPSLHTQLTTEVANTRTHTTMPTTRAAANWAAPRVTALVEMWAIIAEHSGVVGAWRLMAVCKASRVGSRQWLRTLPRLMVCGRFGATGLSDDVWVLDLEYMQWTYYTRLLWQRANHACCAVRDTVVVPSYRLGKTM